MSATEVYIFFNMEKNHFIPDVIVERKTDQIVTTLTGQNITSANWPHPDNFSYIEVAEKCGFSKDQLLDYCFEHELLHSLVPMLFFGQLGYIVRMSAAQKKANLAGAMAEERLIYYVQRYINESIPLIDQQWKRARTAISCVRNCAHERLIIHVTELVKMHE